MGTQHIDRDKLRAAICRMGNEYVYYMLDDAIDLLSDDHVVELARKYLDLNRLRPDERDPAGLLVSVQAFEKASLAGEYYDGFMVNSRNYMEKSGGTIAWITEFRRLLDRCAAEADKGDPAEVSRAFNILFGLLDHIDECHDDVVFFADEAGSWQVGVDWEKILPAWFRVLSATVEPDDYRDSVILMVGEHRAYRKKELLAAAKSVGTPEQRRAMEAVTDRNFDDEFRHLEVRRRAAETARREREAAEARGRYLDDLSSRVAEAWEEVEALVMSKKERNYQESVRLLLDLRELDSRRAGGNFGERLEELRQAHAKKRSFIWELGRAGL